jgi:hypothetical protein
MGLAWVGFAGALACAVETTSDDSFGEVGSGGTDVSTTMRVTAAEEGSSGGDSNTTSPSTTLTTSNDGTDTGSAECGAGSTCVTAVPADWFGPVAVHMGDPEEEAVECPETYPNSGITMLSGYTDPGPAQCDCTCELDVAASCVSYIYDYDNSCGTFENFYQITMDCQPATLDGGVWFYMYLNGNPTCHSVPNNTIPDPIWDAKVMSCRDPEMGAECSTGVCMPVAPEGFETGLCVYREGDHNCPEGDFSVHYSHFSGVEDSRSCSYCGCGSGTASCTGDLQVYQSGDCTGAAQAAALNVCTSGISGGQSAAINFTGDGSCPVATAPMPQGEIATMGEFTFCCTQ